MTVILITGGTRGIGFGLAKAFLELNCQVVICGRNQKSLDRVLAQLSGSHPSDTVLGLPCDVTNYVQVQQLWDRSVSQFGRVDIWVNNAGLSAPRRNFWELDAEEIRTVVSTNLIGVMYGSSVALRGMLTQGFGGIYQMMGLGSDGRRVDRLSVYGTTKSALHYFTESLVDETRNTPVLVGSLSPGMVVTEMLTDEAQDNPQEWKSTRRVFNILADRVETVTPWLAERILENKKHGARIRWLTPGKVLKRFALSPFRSRDLFSDE